MPKKSQRSTHALVQLRHKLDEHLKPLQGKAGAAKLRKAISSPVRLRGKVTAGSPGR